MSKPETWRLDNSAPTLFSVKVDIEFDICLLKMVHIKFMFSKKATKIDEIFNVDLTSYSKCQIAREDLANFCGLLRKHEL